ncbi:MAG: T9SS type A sorting domain-containing protein [Chitinophagaceae bacterium]|nr:T9SS type A sorting domain-containing protein [Chitinophagaceae bacterium]
MGKIFAQAPIINPIPSCMKTKSLDITTGKNHMTGSFYSSCENDAYWKITSTDDGQTVPMCAEVWAPLASSPFNNTNWRPISVVCTGDVNNNANGLCNLKQNSNYYTFVRDFWVDILAPTTVSLNFSVAWDDKIESMILSSGTSSTQIFSTTCTPGNQTVSLNVVVNPGKNTITVNILNRQLFSGNTSPMRFALTGSISTSNQIFLDNKHYIPNTSIPTQPWGCFPPIALLTTPVLTNYCIPPGSSTTNVNISNYNPNLNYSVSPGSFSSPGTFIGTNNVTYTVTAIDASGCTASTTVKVTGKPSISITTPKLCTNTLGSNATLTVQANSPGFAPLTFKNLNTATIFANNIANNTSVNHTISTPNVYTIQVTDANGCSNTSTMTYQYMEVKNPASYASICIGQGANITMPPINVIPASLLSYYWAPGAYTTNPIYVTPSSTTIYTCDVKSDIGCHSINQLAVNVNPLPIITITSNNANCSPSFTATCNTSGNATYAWSGIVSNQTGSTIIAPLSSPPTPPLNGIFSVTCTDANGCVNTKTSTYIQNPFCCNPNVFSNTTFIPKFSSNSPYNNGTSASISSVLGSVINNFSNPIVFDGTILITQNISFINCPNILMAPGTNFIISNGATLSFENCELRSECNYMWNGMIASTPNETIKFRDCNIRDMLTGIQYMDGAKVSLIHNTFIDNWRSVKITNAPTNYTNLNGNCIIEQNTFTTTSNSFLLPPFNSSNQSNIGIQLTSCKTVDIGKLDFGNSMNVFENLVTGILIIHGSLSQIENYNIYDNRFKNIHNEFGWSEQQINSQIASSRQGAGIFFQTVSGFTMKHRLNVVYDVLIDNGFENCDKAIVGHRNNSYLMMLGIVNCFYGVAMFESDLQKQIIQNGIMTGCFNTIYVNGNMMQSSTIKENEIYIRELEMNGTTNPPLGIKIDQLSNNWSHIITIESNIVHVYNHAAGSGIYLNKTGRGMKVSSNLVELQITTPQLPTIGVISAGIYGVDCYGSFFDENILRGPNTLELVNQPNTFSGMKFSQSQHIDLKCNNFEFMKYGLYIEGNCGTNNLIIDKIKGNSFSYLGWGMYFVDNSTLGTLGTIGSTTSLDYNNVFLASGYSNGYYIFRTGTTQFDDRIYTQQITQNLSGATNFNARYVIPPFIGTAYNCSPTNFMVTTSNKYSTQAALDIINNNTTYSSNNLVAHSIDKEGLLTELHYNVLFRNSDPMFQQYYISEQTSDEGLISKIDMIGDVLRDTIVLEDSIAVDSLVNLALVYSNSLSTNNIMTISEASIVYFLAKAINNEMELMTPQEILQLELLASQCPYVGGKGVYLARTLYANIDPSKTYNDEILCTTNFNQKGVSSNQILEKESGEFDKINLYPNPATDKVTLAYSIQPTTLSEVIITDLMGKKIQTISLNHFTDKIDISTVELQKGVYFCSLYSNSTLVQTKKLIVQ